MHHAEVELLIPKPYDEVMEDSLVRSTRLKENISARSDVTDQAVRLRHAFGYARSW